MQASHAIDARRAVDHDELIAWLIVSGCPVPPLPKTICAPQGQLVVEFRAPERGCQILLEVGRDDGTGLAIVFDPLVGLSFELSIGQQGLCPLMAGPFSAPSGVFQIIYTWNRIGNWTLTLQDALQQGPVRTDKGWHAISPPLELLATLTRGGGWRDPSVLWFGVADLGRPPSPHPWVGGQTPIQTRRGPVPAADLRPGDQVDTLDNGPVPILGVYHRQLPGRGSHAPTLLRAPYLGVPADILVSPEQALWLDGADLEYALGEDEALVTARHLTDGHMGWQIDAREVTSAVLIDLGAPELMRCGRGALLSASRPGIDPPRRMLHSYEMQSLRDVLGRPGKHAI